MIFEKGSYTYTNGTTPGLRCANWSRWWGSPQREVTYAPTYSLVRALFRLTPPKPPFPLCA
ncbi:hypothetical protein C8Q74DRAFT_1281270 [Fomes fomentarius]|nr:hypothetical protein C8Q74DRAFT_1281270 [Fomes fomentarius]